MPVLAFVDPGQVSFFLVEKMKKKRFSCLSGPMQRTSNIFSGETEDRVRERQQKMLTSSTIVFSSCLVWGPSFPSSIYTVCQTACLVKNHYPPATPAMACLLLTLNYLYSCICLDSWGIPFLWFFEVKLDTGALDLFFTASPLLVNIGRPISGSSMVCEAFFFFFLNWRAHPFVFL